MQVLCSEYSCAFAGSDAQMQQMIGLLARQGICNGVSLASAGRAKLMFITSSLPADIREFVCSLAEAFGSCICLSLHCLVYVLFQEVASWGVPLQRLGQTNADKEEQKPSVSSKSQFSISLLACMHCFAQVLVAIYQKR